MSAVEVVPGEAVPAASSGRDAREEVRAIRTAICAAEIALYASESYPLRRALCLQTIREIQLRDRIRRLKANLATFRALAEMS